MLDRNTTDRLPPIWIYCMKYLSRNPLLWIPPAAALGLTLLSFWQPASLYWSSMLSIASGLRSTLFYAGWSVMLLPLAHWIQEQRFAEGLDPAVGTGYPVWKILLSQNLCAWTLLAVFGVTMIPFVMMENLPPSFPPGVFLCCLFALTETMLFTAALRRNNRTGFLWIVPALILPIALYTCALSRFYLPDCTPTDQMLWAISLAILAASCRIAVYQPETANKAWAPRLAVLAVILLHLLAGKSKFELPEAPAILLLLAALFERFLPGTMQLAQLPADPAKRGKWFLLQSGVFPGILMGTILLAVLTMMDDGNFLPFGFMIVLFQLAVLLRWRAKIPIVAGLIMLSLAVQILPMILEAEMDSETLEKYCRILDPTSDFWLNLSLPVRNFWAALVALAGALPLYPLYRDYCKRYFGKN